MIKFQFGGKQYQYPNIDETSDNSSGTFSTAIIKGSCFPFMLINRILAYIHSYNDIPLQTFFI